MYKHVLQVLDHLLVRLLQGNHFACVLIAYYEPNTVTWRGEVQDQRNQTNLPVGTPDHKLPSVLADTGNLCP